MTYTVSSGTLIRSIPYHTYILVSADQIHLENGDRQRVSANVNDDVFAVCAGWVSVTADAGLKVSLLAYTPGGLGCSVRSPALLSHAVNLRGRRIRGTAAYRTHYPTFCHED